MIVVDGVDEKQIDIPGSKVLSHFYCRLRSGKSV